MTTIHKDIPDALSNNLERGDFVFSTREQAFDPPLNRHPVTGDITSAIKPQRDHANDKGGLVQHGGCGGGSDAFLGEMTWMKAIERANGGSFNEPTVKIIDWNQFNTQYAPILDAGKELDDAMDTLTDIAYGRHSDDLDKVRFRLRAVIGAVREHIIDWNQPIEVVQPDGTALQATYLWEQSGYFVVAWQNAQKNRSFIGKAPLGTQVLLTHHGSGDSEPTNRGYRIRNKS